MLDFNSNRISDAEVFSFLNNSTVPSGSNVSNALKGLIISNGITAYQSPVPFSTKICVWAITSASGIGIIGNLLVLIVCLGKFRNITPFKFLIGHLAFCDSLFSFTHIFNIAANGWYTDRSYGWIFNSKLCKLSMAGTHLSSLVSVGAILAIAAERFHGIKQEMLSNTPSKIWKKIVGGVCIIWIVAVSSDIPIFLSTRLVNTECQEERKEYFGTEWVKVYSIYLLLVFCLIPMAAMSLMSGMIIMQLKKPVRSSISYYSMLENIIESRKRRGTEDVKILVAIIIAFFVCILPTRCTFVVWSFFDPDSLKITETWSIDSAKLLHSLHVAVNPVIYCVIDKAFRKHLLGIIFCCENEETEIEASSLISEQSSSSLVSLELCIRETITELETDDSLTIPINSKGAMLLFEQHKKANDMRNCFHKETYI